MFPSLSCKPPSVRHVVAQTKAEQEAILIIELIPRCDPIVQDSHKQQQEVSQTVPSRTATSSLPSSQPKGRSSEGLSRGQEHVDGRQLGRTGYCSCNLYRVLTSEPACPPAPHGQHVASSSSSSISQLVGSNRVAEELLLDTMKLNMEDAALEQVRS